jgi:hypothetical protein
MKIKTGYCFKKNLHIRRKHDNNNADDHNNKTFLHNMLDRLSALKDQPPAHRPAEYVNPAGPQDYKDSVHLDKSRSFHGFNSVNDEDFHGFDSTHDSDSYYDPERPMFQSHDPDLTLRLLTLTTNWTTSPRTALIVN